MPIACGLTSLSGAGLSTAGDYLASVADGTSEPADLVAVPVDADGQLNADQGLEEFLPVPAAQIAAAYQLTGQAGQAAQAAALVGSATVRVVFLGVGDRSPSALRRAGAEPGRLVADGNTAAAAVVPGAPDEQVQAFAEGILLGSYKFSLKSSGSDQAAAGQVALLLCPWRGSTGSHSTRR